METKYFVYGVCIIWLSCQFTEVEPAPAKAAAGIVKEMAKQLKKSPDLLLDLAGKVKENSKPAKQQPAAKLQFHPYNPPVSTLPKALPGENFKSPTPFNNPFNSQQPK